MNEERFIELQALSQYGLMHIIQDQPFYPNGVREVIADYQEMTEEIERLRAAIEFIYSYADGEFNGADGSDMYAHRRDLYTITQLCITALDGEPLTDDLIVKDEPAAATVTEQWTPQRDMRIYSPDDDVTGTIMPISTQPGDWEVFWDDEEVSEYPEDYLVKTFKPIRE